MINPAALSPANIAGYTESDNPNENPEAYARLYAALLAAALPAETLAVISNALAAYSIPGPSDSQTERGVGLGAAALLSEALADPQNTTYINLTA